MYRDAVREITGAPLPRIPRRGGLAFHRPEGPSGCPACGWCGVPTLVGGRKTDDCPRCDTAGDYELLSAPATKVGRNQPCPCGSGKKAKKCCYG